MSKPIETMTKGFQGVYCDYSRVIVNGFWCSHSDNVDDTRHDEACTKDDWEHCELMDTKKLHSENER